MRHALPLAIACLAVLLQGCGDSSSSGDSSSAHELPPGFPAAVGGLRVGAARPSEATVTSKDAIAIARHKLLNDAGPGSDPESFVTRITGPIFGEGVLVGTPDDPATFPTVRNRLAWLVLWRGIEEREVAPPVPFHPAADSTYVMDFVVFVDARTGEILKNVRLGGVARLP